MAVKKQKPKVKPVKVKRTVKAKLGMSNSKLLSQKARKLLHRRFGHASEQKMRLTSKVERITGFPYGGPHGKDCITCIRMNGAKKPFSKHEFERATKAGQRIHSDIKEVPADSIGGHRYAVCFVDCCTRRGAVYPLKTLQGGEVVDCFRDYIEDCEQKGIVVECLRADNGSQYTSEEMFALCRTRKGPQGESRIIRQEFSPPYCQSANGVAESFWRDTFRFVRTILWDQQRGSEYWVAALQFANWIRNRLARTTTPDSVPEVEFTGKDQDYSKARVPLVTCCSFVEKENRNGVKTLSNRRQKMVLVGYASDSGCYQVYDPESNTRKPVNRRYADVHFVDEASHAPDGPMEVAVCDAFEAAFELSLKNAADERLKNGDPTPLVINTELAKPKDGVTYVRTSKDRTVTELARMFNVDALDYLELLREHQGTDYKTWFDTIVDISSQVKKGSDVPLKIHDPTRPLAHAKSELGTPPGGAAGGSSGPDRGGSEERGGSKKRKAVDPEDARSTAPNAKVPRAGTRQSNRIKDQQAHSAALAESYEELEMLWAESLLSLKPQGRVAKECNAMAASLQEFLRVDVTAPAKRTPKSSKQAAAIDQQEGNDDWEKSQEAEWNGLWSKGCFEDQLMTGQKLHHLLWVYKIKSCGRKKSRLTLDGRNQDPSTYDEIRSPTMRLTSMRCLLSLSAANGWDVYADDAEQGFINALRPEDKPLWAAYPQQFREPGRCLLIKRMLYGLHDAPRGWFECVKKHLIEGQGLTQSGHDECLFMNADKTLVVVVHVDDFLSTGTPAALKKYRDALHHEFKMTGGPVTEYFGLDVKIDKTRRRASLSAQTYIINMVKKLGISPKKVSTPLEPDAPLQRMPGITTDKVLQKRYRSLVGSILHPANTCRPDVAAAARELSTHLLHPTQEHVKAAERVCQYLYNTKELELAYNGYSPSRLYGTCDASHNSEPEAKGVTGYTFHLNGGSVCWKSSTQKLVALSSCESELIAIDMCTRELRSVLGIVKDMGIRMLGPTEVGQDNLATITLVNDGHFNARTRHIDLRFHHAHQQQQLGTLKVVYLDTHNMSADVLTKQLPVHSFLLHRSVLLGHQALKWPPLTK
jgi:transposase InsO family protein